MAGRAEYEQKDDRYLPCRTQAGPRAEVVGEDEPHPLAGRVLVSVRGVLQVHSAPPALCSHVEWAVAGVIGMPVSLPWVDQAAAPGMVRAELDWQASPGASAAITSALAGWSRLRVAGTEDGRPGRGAVRYSPTPR